MDSARTHTAQSRIKQIMTPFWDRAMGVRFRIVRELILRRQEDMAALLSTPGRPVHRQQIDLVERGQLRRLNVTWARLEAVFGKHLLYVLIARDEANYDAAAIHLRFYDYFQRAMRKRRNGPDPKLGEALPAKPRLDLRSRIQMGRELPKKRGSTDG